MDYTQLQSTPIHQLAAAIHRLYSCETNEQRQLLTNEFLVLEQNAQSHIQNVVAVLQDITLDQISNDIKMSVGVYLKNFAEQLFKNVTNKVIDDNEESKRVAKQELSFLISIFTSAILSPNCQMRYKHNLTQQLNRFLITYVHLDSDQDDSYNMLCEFVKHIIVGLNQLQNFETLNGAITLCESAFISANSQDIFQKVFESLSPMLTSVAESAVAQFNLIAPELLNNFQALANAQDDLSQKVLNILKILASWTRTHHQILERFESQSYFGYENFVRSNSHSNVYLMLLGLNINKQTQPNCLMSVSGVQQIDQLINEIKSKCLESIRLLLDFVFDQMNKSQQESVPYVTRMNAVAPVLIKSAHFFATNPNLTQMLEDQQLSDLLIQILDVLIVMSDQNMYANIFQENMANILVSICLNLMKTTASEAGLIMDDPQEFINLALDCCDKQKSQTVKTQACMLLEHICDNVDGGTTCITTFACNALNFALKKGLSPALIAEQGLWGMENDPFLCNSQPVLIAETCIVALTVISYILPKKDHLVPLFQEALAQNIDQILASVPTSRNSQPIDQCLAVVLRARFSLLLGYYADMIFVQHKAAFIKTMDFLFSSVSFQNGTPEQVIALQSIDTLNTVVSDTDLAPRLEPMMSSIVTALNSITPNITYPTYFEFLQEFIKIYSPVLKDNYIVSIFQTVVGRILIEQSKKQADPGYNSQVIISKCWNVVRVAVDRPEYMPLHAKTFEEIMTPLFIFLADPTQISFDDDILMCLKCIIKRLKTVSQLQWEIFTQFPKILEKNKHSFGHLLDALNYYLVFGKADLQVKNQDCLNLIAQMAETALFTQNKNVTINNTEGAILIQLTFQMMRGSNALNGIFESILERLRARIQNQNVQRSVKNHVLLAFLSAILYNNNATLAYLEKNQMTVPFVEEIVAVSKQLKHKYELKLVVIAFSEMLICQNLPVELRPKMVPLIQELLDIKQRIKQLEDQENKLADQEGNEDDAESDNSDDEEEDDQTVSDDDYDDELGFVDANNDGEYEKDYTESKFDITVTLDILDSPVKKVDETLAFQAALRSLSQRSPQDLQILIGCLPQDKKKLIMEMFQAQKVQVSENDSATRRIVKVKRQVNLPQRK